jgi:cytochrome c biogenesis protein ResB
MTAVGREERTLLFTPGEQRGIDEAYRVTLTDFEYQRYPSGAPKDWISQVRIHRNGELYREQVRIEVNDPLRLGPYTLYQVHHAHRPVARFTDGESREYRVIAGHWKELGDAQLLFAAVPEGSGEEIPHGMFMLREGMKRSARRLAPGDRIFGLELKELEHRHISGLKVVRDPGYRLVLIGFVLAGLGLMLTYIVKIINVREDS